GIKCGNAHSARSARGKAERPAPSSRGEVRSGVPRDSRFVPRSSPKGFGTVERPDLPSQCPQPLHAWTVGQPSFHVPDPGFGTVERADRKNCEDEAKSGKRSNFNREGATPELLLEDQLAAVVGPTHP